MAKPKEFTIKENISTLKQLRKKQDTFRIEKRIIWLIELKQNRFKTRYELACYLGVTTKHGGFLCDIINLNWYNSHCCGIGVYRACTS